MSGKPPNLAQIQRWMQSVIMHSGGVAAGVESPAAREHIDLDASGLESVICRSRALAAEERLEIYVNAYYERLLECLREEYAVTRRALADDLFDALAFGYLQQHPSRSYTLAALGDEFPGYLAETGLHVQEAPAGAPATWGQMIVELAQFERLLRGVFDGPGSEQLPPIDPAALLPIAPEGWDRVRLVVTPSLRLAEFSHPVQEFWQALKAEQPAGPPSPRHCRVAVYRQDYRIDWRELTARQFQLLSRMASGASLSDAIGDAMRAQAAPAADWEGQLPTWFADWTRSGVIVAVGQIV